MRFLSFLVLFFSFFFLIRSESTEDLNISEEKKCFKPLDVVFVLDGSGSVNDKSWIKELLFAKEAANSFRSLEETHFALISYSTRVDTVWSFEKKTSTNAELFEERLFTVVRSKGITNTHLGLLKAHELLKNRGTLEDRAKVIILVTDGISSHRHKAKLAASAIMKSGIIMFVVGVGRQSDMGCKELLNCASKTCPNYIHTGWKDLLKQVKKIILTVCDDPIKIHCGEWTEWSACDCKSKKQKRTKVLKSGLSDISFTCPEEVRDCTEPYLCPVNAGCGKWGEFSECSASCGVGERKRKRINYNIPKAINGGLTCEEQKIFEVETELCNVKECPTVDDCKKWGNCTTHCRKGGRKRRHDGSIKLDEYGGLSLENQGIENESEDCEEPYSGPCASVWTPWSSCSDNCREKAVRTRHSTRLSFEALKCQTFEHEMCSNLPECVEQPELGGNSNTILIACGASVAAACLLGGAAYYAKNQMASAPPSSSSDFESSTVDPMLNDENAEQAIFVGGDAEDWSTQ